MQSIAALCAVLFGLQLCHAATVLPNTTGIDGQLTDDLAVDYFFSLWIVFNNEQVNVSEKPFTILAPQNNASKVLTPERAAAHPELVRKLLLDHIVLGQKLDLQIKADLSFTTLGGRTVNIRRYNGVLHANGAKIVTDQVNITNGRLVIIDNYLFPEYLTEDHSFLQDMTEVLSFLQSGVRVFQHLLAKTNVTHKLNQGDYYTVLVPTDNAFQRWHPIDWGFNPFSVPEFTEKILTNHFIKGNVRQESITDEQSFKSLAGEEIIFKRKGATLTVNGVEVIKGDTPVTRGNIMFISEVLFVNSNVVEQLHKSNLDKETAPLFTYPWTQSLFLSHAYHALENKPHYQNIAKLLSIANIGHHLMDHRYTFFVPSNEALDAVNLTVDVPQNYFLSKKNANILLNHFIKKRLYDKDLRNGTVLTTLANETLHVFRTNDKLYIENALVTEREVFVYNLGTMYFIDKVLYPKTTIEPETTTLIENPTEMSTNPEIEIVPEEIGEPAGNLPDSLLQE